MTSGNLNIDLRKKLTEVVSKLFLTSLPLFFFSFRSTMHRSRVKGRASRRPQADQGSFRVPARRGLIVPCHSRRVQVCADGYLENCCLDMVRLVSFHTVSPSKATDGYFDLLSFFLSLSHRYLQPVLGGKRSLPL